jgi:ubiquinone/menaquinone biosynthesis C-methylase UbiE
MTETIGERMSRYVLDSSDEDLQRLLKLAELSAEPTRAAFRKIGVKPGWRVIDCGCGPLGALAVMAEMVGPEGQVVGIDFSEAAVQRARSIVSTLGLDNVEFVSVMSTTSMGRRWEARSTSHTPGCS